MTIDDIPRILPDGIQVVACDIPEGKAVKVAMKHPNTGEQLYAIYSAFVFTGELITLEEVVRRKNRQA